MTREEVVELADAVAAHEGIASGIGTMTYAAQIVIDAPTSSDAVERARTVFADAAARAGLPAWPIVWSDPVSEEDEELP